MSDPVRLVDGPNAAAGALLEAWSGERPSGDARRRALGLASSLGAGAALTGAGAGAGAKGAAPIAGTLALTKWIVVGAFAAMAAAGAGILAIGPAGVAAPAAPVNAPESTNAGVAASSPSGVTIPVLTPHDLPSADTAFATAPHGTSSTKGGTSPHATVASAPLDLAHPLPTATDAPVTADEPAASVARELAAIDRARAAVRRGDGAGALALLNAFDAEFPKSSLGDEVVVVRVDALVRAGRTARAAEIAREFVEQKPSSPYAARLRAVAGPSDRGPTTNP